MSALPQTTEASNETSATNLSRTQQPLMHKNRLQEYTQRSSMKLPVYQTANEGSLHAPRFKSTVFVDGTSYTSANTFSHRKAAEQDVARLALESIAKKIKDEGCPVIREDAVFCKSILNEFAVKMNLGMPTYNTIQSRGVIPLFESSLVFNGVTYNGKTARNKKEAEQLAARAALLSLLGDSSYGTFLSEIIKSKAKLYTALDKLKDPNIYYLATKPTGANTLMHESEEVETATVTNNVPTGAVLQPNSGAKPPHEVVHKTKEVETAAVPDSVPTGAVLQPNSGAKPPHEVVHKTKEVETAAVPDSVPTGAVLQPNSGAKPPHEVVHKTKEVETAAVPDSVPTGAVLQPNSGAKPPHEVVRKTKEVETAAVPDRAPTGAVLQPCSAAKPPHEVVDKTKEVEMATVPDRVPTIAILSSGAKRHHELIETAIVTDNVPTAAILQPSAGAKPPHHEFRIPKSELDTECINLPITFVPSALEQSSGVSESPSRKKRKRKKRAKQQADTQLAVAGIPLSQAAPCSAAL